VFDVNDVHCIKDNDLVAPAYVINLDRKPDRWAKMSAQLSGLGVDYQRFSAVEGYNVIITAAVSQHPYRGVDLKSNTFSFSPKKIYNIACNPNDEFGSNISNSFRYFTSSDRLATAGELGCTCSHRSIWDNVALHNLPYIIVLEDDISFKDKFLENTASAIAAMPADADLLYLHILPIDEIHYPSEVSHRYSESDEDVGKIVRFLGNPWGTQAYIVTLSGAKKLLQLTRLLSVHAIDDAIIKNKGKLNIYTTLRNEIESSMDSSQSEIYQMGRFN